MFVLGLPTDAAALQGFSHKHMHEKRNVFTSRKKARVCKKARKTAVKPWVAHEFPKRGKLVAEPGFDPGTFGL